MFNCGVIYSTFDVLSGVFVGPLSELRSHRWTIMVGIFLMGVGSILSAFANSPADLYLSVGLWGHFLLLLTLCLVGSLVSLITTLFFSLFPMVAFVQMALVSLGSC